MNDVIRNNEEQIKELFKELFKDKLLVRKIGEVSTRVDPKTFTHVSTVTIEFCVETIWDYYIIFGEEEFYKEAGRLLFGESDQ